MVFGREPAPASAPGGFLCCLAWRMKPKVRESGRAFAGYALISAAEPCYMSFIADALLRVKPSATIAATQKARDLKERRAGYHFAFHRGAGFRHAGQY